MKQYKEHFKECSPRATVKFLKKILNNYNIKTEEIWNKKSEIQTSSCRIQYSGTNIGANGKGINRSYARASGYAEFFERYQNNLLAPNILFHNKDFNFYYCPDEKIISHEDIINNENSFTKYIFPKIGLDKLSFLEKTKYLSSLMKGDELFFGLKGSSVCLPFYSYSEKKVVYLPKILYTSCYGSNGMCAGNTIEEALVQGLSEIIERIVQKKIFLEKPVLPDVPVSYLNKFKHIKNKIKALNKNKYGIKYFIKDCSFGGKYPVAALISYEKNTGKYGIKLGCHPSYGIAIERCLTEATQGQKLMQYSEQNIFTFSNVIEGKEEEVIYNSYKTGVGAYPYQMFISNNPTYEFKECRDVTKLTNSEIIKIWLKEINNEGYDILIRNVSSFGFPALHIIIPNFLEMFELDNKRLRALNSRYYCSGLLTDKLETFNDDEANLMLATMTYFINDTFENSLSSYYPFIDKTILPYYKYNCDCLYFMAMLHVFLGEYRDAEKKLMHCMKILKVIIKPQELKKNKEFSFLAASRLYVEGIINKIPIDKIKNGILTLFDNDISNKVFNLYEDNKKILIKQYPNVIQDKMSFTERFKKEKDKVLNFTIALKKAEIKSHILQDDIEKLIY